VVCCWMLAVVVWFSWVSDYLIRFSILVVVEVNGSFRDGGGSGVDFCGGVCGG
jgi:hypothetical protein